LSNFELEQQIMGCWQIVDDLRVVSEAVLERDLNADQVVNLLVGLEQLYQLKFDKCFRTFEQVLEEQRHAKNVE
jgi:hypothetical protein